jgi:alkylation response protein AidB-like acyl-CoA dehydrogenase
MLSGLKEFCQEFLTDVRVPDRDRVGDVDDGWTVGTGWMFHERMGYNSPYVTRPLGVGSEGSTNPALAIAHRTGRLHDPAARELVGESHMLALARRELLKRVADGIATGAMSSQAAAIGRLFTGAVTARTSTIAFELVGSAGAAWADDDGEIAGIGGDFLMRQASCIGGGTTEMARNVISERVLGMPRERVLDRDVPFRDVPRSRPSSG